MRKSQVFDYLAGLIVFQCQTTPTELFVQKDEKARLYLEPAKSFNTAVRHFSAF